MFKSECKKEHTRRFKVTTGREFIRYMHEVFIQVKLLSSVIIGVVHRICLHASRANRKGHQEYINKPTTQIESNQKNELCKASIEWSIVEGLCGT